MSQSTLFLIFAVSIGLLAGGLLGSQPSINGSLSKALHHPMQASLISFGSGTVILLAINIALGIFPPRLQETASGLPWWVWMGGSIGVVMVSTSLFFVPRIGSLPWFAAVMTGQTLIAVILDHYGLLGNVRSPVSVLRVIGTALLVLGVLAIVTAKRMEQSANMEQAANMEQETSAVAPSGVNPKTTSTTPSNEDHPPADLP